MLNDKASQTSFAELVGVTQQAISKHCASGVLKKGGTHSEWLLEYCEQLRIEAAGRDVAEDIKAATIREKNANADKKELETDIMRGTVVNMTDVYAELMPAIQHIKSTLSGASEKIKISIEATYGIKLDIRYIDDPLFASMSEIAQYEAKRSSASDELDASDGTTT